MLCECIAWILFRSVLCFDGHIPSYFGSANVLQFLVRNRFIKTQRAYYHLQTAMSMSQRRESIMLFDTELYINELVTISMILSNSLFDPPYIP